MKNIIPINFYDIFILLTKFIIFYKLDLFDFNNLNFNEVYNILYTPGEGSSNYSPE